MSLLKLPITADQLAALFEKITGRKPTEADIEAARRTLAKGLHVLVAVIMLGSIAMAQPSPYAGRFGRSLLLDARNCDQ